MLLCEIIGVFEVEVKVGIVYLISEDFLMFVCILVVIIVLMLIGDVLFVGFDSDVVCWVWVFE